jgi:hypothetical protein
MMSHMATKRKIEKSEDGHYVVIDGRKWRATNPNLPEAKRQELVNELMAARRAVGAALKAKDSAAEKSARERVQAVKEALGERGPKWWEASHVAKADVVSENDRKGDKE